MKRILLLTVALACLWPEAAEARLQWFTKKKAAPAPAAPAKKKEQRPEPEQGLFGVQRVKDDYYFQVADSLLGHPFLVTTRFVSTPVELGVYGGELVSSHVLYFERQDKRLLLRALMYDATADTTEQIHRALVASTEDPILAAFKLDSVATRPDSVYSIKVTDFLRGDNLVTGLRESVKKRHGATGLQAEQSYIDYVHTFPTNTEVATVKTYGAKTDGQASVSGRLTGLMTFRLNTSFVLLPKDPMRPRYFDPRVGYFIESHREYSDVQQQVRRRHMATRWRLEPKDSADIERLRRGELIEPKKPIVFYIDPATPRRWRPYLIQGVNDWNVAFEQAGWKNAIRAEEWPEADSTMSLEDARYSVIRYLASPIPNAYGPHVSDPRSGEIIESHIGWYHNVMQLIHDWYIIQAGAVDPRARTMQLPDSLMGELIRFVSSHEVGHTLGLRHNMGASSATPVDSLRCKAWVEANGHTASIMDYARFNYVAQPEDGIGPAGIFPRINTYDKWAIEWGYRWFPDDATVAAVPDSAAPAPLGSYELRMADRERLLLHRMTLDRLARSRRYWFGGEGSDNDPRAQTEDLGDDAMRASELGIRNLRRIVGQLPGWVQEEGDLDLNLEQLYTSLVGQMNRYVGHVVRNVGGLYRNYDNAGLDAPVYVPEEKARVRRALDFLDREVFTEPTWLTDVPYISRLTDEPQSKIRLLANRALGIVSAETIHNVAAYAYARDAYQPADYAQDVVRLLFREAASGRKVTPWRMYVQRQAVQRLLKSWTATASEAEHPYITSMLLDIRQKVRSAAAPDAATRAHYKDLDLQITRAFEK